MYLYKILSKLISWIFPTKEHRKEFRSFCEQVDKELVVKHNYKKVIKKIRKKYNANEKIRVLFLVRENSKWQYDSFYKILEASDKFEPLIAVTLLTSVANGRDKTRYNLDENYEFFEKLGYNVVKAFDKQNHKYIDLKTFKPDIVFYDQQWELPELYKPDVVSNYAITCNCPYAYFIFDEPSNYAKSFHKLLYTYFVEDALNIERYKKYSKELKNCVTYGYPKMDIYFDMENYSKSDIWKDSEKFKMIYAPHHSFDPKGLKLATFKENGKFILELAKAHPETTWLFKPHPRFKFALLKDNVMTEAEIEEYYSEWERIGKIYEQGNYFDIFNSSDLLITDCGSFLCEYLPTKNPILQLVNPNHRNFNLFGQKITSHNYMAYSCEDIEKYFEELVVKKNDYLKEKRLDLISELIDFSEPSSQKIIKYLVEKVIKDSAKVK